MADTAGPDTLKDVVILVQFGDTRTTEAWGRSKGIVEPENKPEVPVLVVVFVELPEVNGSTVLQQGTSFLRNTLSIDLRFDLETRTPGERQSTYPDAIRGYILDVHECSALRIRLAYDVRMRETSRQASISHKVR